MLLQTFVPQVIPEVTLDVETAPIALQTAEEHLAAVSKARDDHLAAVAQAEALESTHTHVAQKTFVPQIDTHTHVAQQTFVPQVIPEVTLDVQAAPIALQTAEEHLAAVSKAREDHLAAVAKAEALKDDVVQGAHIEVQQEIVQPQIIPVQTFVPQALIRPQTTAHHVQRVSGHQHHHAVPQQLTSQLQHILVRQPQTQVLPQQIITRRVEPTFVRKSIIRRPLLTQTFLTKRARDLEFGDRILPQKQ